MKTRLIWHNCKLNDNKNSFWVECTDDEVAKDILPFVSEKKDELLQEIEQNRGYSLINRNENERIFCNFFLISTDCNFIKSYIWQMPYAGMWGAYNPFREIEVIDFNALEELEEIYEKLQPND